MPPKKKDADHVAPVVEEPEKTVVHIQGVVKNEELPDAAVALYKDRSGAARTQGVTEGSGYSRTMANNAREAVGLPPLPEE